MTSLPRWLGMSVALHLALGIGVWASWTAVPSTERRHPTPGLMISLVDASDIRSTPSRAVPAGPPRVLVDAPPPIAPTPRDIPRADVTQADDVPPSVPDPDPPAPSEPDPTDPGSAAAQPPPDPSSSEQAGDNPNTDSSPPAAPDAAAGAAAAVDRYRPLVLAILERAKRYPLLAQRWGVEGTVEIAFTIAQDGRLSAPEVIVTSRHNVLDDATVDMVRRIGSLPPPPDRNPLRFAASIQYTLDATTTSSSTKGAPP